MSHSQLAAKNAVQSRPHAKPVFFNPETLPWTQWAMPGTWFKLLSVHRASGGWTMLLKVDPGTVGPVHHHVGAIEGYLIGGEFGYGTDRGSRGWFLCEPPGAVHEPDTKEGLMMFATFFGPVTGFSADGTIAAVVDAETMYKLAKSNGAHAHIEWTDY